MAEIKAVMFDHGGVLTRGGEKGTNEKAASRAMGLTEVIVIPDINEALKRGAITNAEYVDEINHRFPDAPTRLTMGMWDDIYAALERDPLAYEFAERCRQAGYRVGILSSVNATIARRLYDDGSYKGFLPVVLSCFEGTAKPDPEIYAVVEEDLEDRGIRPSQILFLDDQEKCCVGARARGWQAIRVDSAEQMIRYAGALLRLNGGTA